MEKTSPDCAQCPYRSEQRLCRSSDGKFPAQCPTRAKGFLIEQSVTEYRKPDVREFARQASIQEAEGYSGREPGGTCLRPLKPRILEIVEFARKMAYKRLGLAFCGGLGKEARIVGSFFASHGFDVVSVVCKVGRVPKEEIGILDHEKVRIGKFEVMCNPILQAGVLNEERTEMNVLLGLCVGHDSLFLKYASAPCTVLAVKDRVLVHNPLAGVYALDHYCRYLKPF
ncbi:MAG: hypothetical protein A4E73_02087 [Syntrophaceae bacterium PtaU1.Bin231]|nr:MAG: hypothetical protein A4E73_02087 [Syntrophaceae bacterium PtaU1.Bin231]HOG16239.1 DUF1847 domain-containing protein [Syntrophales bacterium]